MASVQEEAQRTWLASDDSAEVRQQIKNIVVPVSRREFEMVDRLMRYIAVIRQDAFDEGFNEAY